MNEKVTLSARMQAVADMVTKGNRVCDVGCDHGYVSIYLVLSGISPKILAMDINEGPLMRAKEHIVRAGLMDYITLRRSDGLVEYEQGEADTLICAGMGGRLMQRILEREPLKSKDFKELILQPQSEVSLFRKYMRKVGYSIEWEDMILEENKFYPIIKAVPIKQDNPVQDNEQELCDRFGPVLLKNRHPVLKKYLKKEWENSIKIKSKLTLADDSCRAVARLKALDEEMLYLKKAAEICGCELA